MKATEIKNMPVDELNAKLDSLKEELFALRFQLAANQPKSQRHSSSSWHRKA